MNDIKIGAQYIRKCGAIGEVASIDDDTYNMRIISPGANHWVNEHYAHRKLWPSYDTYFMDGTWQLLEGVEELPPAPTSVRYLDQFSMVTGTPSLNPADYGLLVRRSKLHPVIAMRIGRANGLGASNYTRLDADSALQLAHDLRRMAMEIKREEKVDG